MTLLLGNVLLAVRAAVSTFDKSRLLFYGSRAEGDPGSSTVSGGKVGYRGCTQVADPLTGREPGSMGDPFMAAFRVARAAWSKGAAPAWIFPAGLGFMWLAHISGACQGRMCPAICLG